MRVEFEGYCPVCESDASFVAERQDDLASEWHPHWFRDALRCTHCGSKPRERALAKCINGMMPSWRDAVIHECSPAGVLSDKLARECGSYISSQYDPNRPFGVTTPEGWRNENLEAQTFDDFSFDMVVTQDVFEHLLHPVLAAREIARTLKPGGVCAMTVPIVNNWGVTTTRASLINGNIVHHLPEQYHGNPVGNGRSLVTVDWSYDIGAQLSRHSSLNFTVVVIDDMSIGVRDPHNVVLCARKS